MSFDEGVAMLRRWLGWPPARRVALPSFLAEILYRLGDAVSYLGWTPPAAHSPPRDGAGSGW